MPVARKAAPAPTIDPQLLLKLEAEEEVLRVLAAAGLTSSNGSARKDSKALAKATLAALLRAQVVSDPGQREANAWTKAVLTSKVFPDLLPPHKAKTEVQKLVFNAIQSDVWRVTNPEGGLVQTMLMREHPNLMVLHTKIGIDALDAVYVTDDPECVKLDHMPHQNDHVRKGVTKATKGTNIAQEIFKDSAHEFAEMVDSNIGDLRRIARVNLHLRDGKDAA